MKKWIVLMMLMASVVGAAEYVPVEAVFGDGQSRLFANRTVAILSFHGTCIDSVVFDTTADNTAWKTLVDSISTDSVGEHQVNIYFVDASGDTLWETPKTWDNSIIVVSDSTLSGSYLSIGNMAGGLNLVNNGGFEDDSVYSGNSPQSWSQSWGTWTSSGTVASGVEGRWDYRMTATKADTFIMYNVIGYINAGQYILSCQMRNYNGDSVSIALDSGLTCGLNGWVDSITTATAAMRGYSKIISVLNPGYYTIGVMFYANSLNDYADFDNVKLEYTSPFTVVPTDTTATGQPVNLIPSTALAADTAAYQGAASGLTAAEIMDSLLGIAVADTVTGRIIAQLLSQLDSIQTAMADGHVAKQKDSALFTADSVLYVGTVDTVLSSISAVADLAGDGSYAVTIRAVDSSGTDAAISGVPIAIWDMTSTLQGYLTTNSSGYVVFEQDSGSFIISAATRDGYRWIRDTVLVPAAAVTDTLWGYNIPVGSPGSANLCRLYGYIYNISGTAVEGATVTASLPGSGLIDSCAAVSLDGYEVSATTDSVGYWYLDLVKTLCIQSTIGGTAVKYYKVVGRYPSGNTAFSKNYEVPDSTSHKITW